MTEVERVPLRRADVQRWDGPSLYAPGEVVPHVPQRRASVTRTSARGATSEVGLEWQAGGLHTRAHPGLLLWVGNVAAVVRLVAAVAVALPVVIGAVRLAVWLL